jgi:hypothetical protein
MLATTLHFNNEYQTLPCFKKGNNGINIYTWKKTRLFRVYACLNLFVSASITISLSSVQYYVCSSVCLTEYLSGCLTIRLFVWSYAYLSFCLSFCLPICRMPVCLFACLPVCLSACLPVCLSACLPVCLSACLLSACQSVCPSSVCRSVCLFTSLSMYLSACLSFCGLPFCLSICLPVCQLSVCLFISLSMYQSVHLTICSSVCLSIFPSINPPICPSVFWYEWKGDLLIFEKKIMNRFLWNFSFLSNFVNKLLVLVFLVKGTERGKMRGREGKN